VEKCCVEFAFGFSFGHCFEPVQSDIAQKI
jgi:hypothetical protein